MASVASFFISRIDTLEDSKLEEKSQATSDVKQQALLKSLLGKVAIGNGKLNISAAINASSADRAGRHWRPRARRPSACCGPARARRIPIIANVIYVKN